MRVLICTITNRAAFDTVVAKRAFCEDTYYDGRTVTAWIAEKTGQAIERLANPDYTQNPLEYTDSDFIAECEHMEVH